MLVLRLTQSLLKDMKAAAIEDCESSLLFSWHANMVYAKYTSGICRPYQPDEMVKQIDL
jgi:hypothetical protein